MSLEAEYGIEPSETVRLADFVDPKTGKPDLEAFWDAREVDAAMNNPYSEMLKAMRHAAEAEGRQWEDDEAFDRRRGLSSSPPSTEAA